jgi:chromosome segregation ATPase
LPSQAPLFSSALREGGGGAGSQAAPMDDTGAEVEPGPLPGDELPGGDDGDYPDYLEEEEDDDDGAEDDGDNPVLARLQEALSKQLLAEDERITEELRVKEEDLRRAKKKREDIGAELYTVQQQLAKLQMQLEGTHDRYKDAAQAREHTEGEAQQATEVYQQERQQVIQYKGKVDKNQVELDKVNSTIRQVQAYNEAMKDEVAVTRRATYKAEEATTQLEKEKNSQDLLIDSLNQKVQEGTEQLGLYEAQLAAQKKETAAAAETLFEASREMEAISFEKKHLVQQWKSSLVGMARRDEALQKANEQITGTIEASQALDAEIVGYKKEISAEQSTNEQLVAVLDKLERDEALAKKQAEAVEQRNARSAHQHTMIRKALEDKDAQLIIEKKKYKQVQDKVRQGQKEVQTLQNKIHEVELQTDSIKSQQLTIEKGTENTVKDTGSLLQQAQEKEQEITQFENELARIRVDALNTQAHNDGLRQTLSSFDGDLQEKTELVARYEVEIRKRNNEIEKKQSEVDRLNRRYDALVGAQEAPESTGPLEATIYNLNKSIAAKTAENAELQKRWITLQTELVNIVTASNEKSERLQELHSTSAILQHKKMRQELALQAETKEIAELDAGIRKLHQDMKRLNELLSKNEDMQAKLTDENFNLETDFVKKLKELEMQSIESEAKIHATSEEKNQLLNDIVEAEKQVMLWERKIQLEKETQSTLDAGVGQDVVRLCGRLSLRACFVV